MIASYPAPGVRSPTTRPIALLIEPSETTRAQLTDLLVDQGYSVRVANGLTEAHERALLLGVEADRGWRTIALARQMRTIRPDARCIGVLRWWNEDERELRALADLVIHVPFRKDELDAVAEL